MQRQEVSDISEAGESVSRTQAAEWTGKHQGFLGKRSVGRFNLFGGKYKQRW
jgi:hypothetical protein